MVLDIGTRDPLYANVPWAFFQVMTSLVSLRAT